MALFRAFFTVALAARPGTGLYRTIVPATPRAAASHAVGEALHNEAAAAVHSRSSAGGCHASTPDGAVYDFSALRDAGVFSGTDALGNTVTFAMCPASLPGVHQPRGATPDCHASAGPFVATQQGEFGCSVLAQWLPNEYAPVWSALPDGVRLSIASSGNACADGSALRRSIVVDFVCAEELTPAEAIVVTEDVMCEYAWRFSTSAACAPAVAPVGNAVGSAAVVQEATLGAATPYAGPRYAPPSASHPPLDSKAVGGDAAAPLAAGLLGVDSLAFAVPSPLVPVPHAVEYNPLRRVITDEVVMRRKGARTPQSPRVLHAQSDAVHGSPRGAGGVHLAAPASGRTPTPPQSSSGSNRNSMGAPLRRSAINSENEQLQRHGAVRFISAADSTSLKRVHYAAPPAHLASSEHSAPSARSGATRITDVHEGLYAGATAVGDTIACSQSLFQNINVVVTQPEPCTIKCINAACGGAVMACIHLSEVCRGVGIVCQPPADADTAMRAAASAAHSGPNSGGFTGCTATLVSSGELELRASGGVKGTGVGLTASAIVLNVAGTPSDPGTIFGLLVQQHGGAGSSAAAGAAAAEATAAAAAAAAPPAGVIGSDVGGRGVGGDDDPYNDRVGLGVALPAGGQLGRSSPPTNAAARVDDAAVHRRKQRGALQGARTAASELALTSAYGSPRAVVEPSRGGATTRANSTVDSVAFDTAAATRGAAAAAGSTALYRSGELIFFTVTFCANPANDLT